MLRRTPWWWLIALGVVAACTGLLGELTPPTPTGDGGSGDPGDAGGAADAGPTDAGEVSDIPANTWVRLADSPGDAEGREVPPGRASTWVWEPATRRLLRYGGYTPRFSNALDAFDPAGRTWQRLFAEDETYPDDRPGGGCLWTLQRGADGRVWLAGGRSNGTAGSPGIWAYEPTARTFEAVARTLPAGVTRLTLDVAHGLYVASPGAAISYAGKTQVFDLATRAWKTEPTPSCPQTTWGGDYPAVYDEGLESVVLLGNDDGASLTAWRFDAAARTWTRLATTNPPPARALFTAAYDSDHRVIVMHGIHPGPEPVELSDLADTWVLDTATLEWTELKTPGPTPLTSSRGSVTTYRFAFTYAPELRRFFLFDADLGVWAFRYEPGAPPGPSAQADGFDPQVGQAAANPPAPGPAEVRLTLPSALNPRITAMGDDTLLALGGGRVPGDEVGWWYDSDRGVLVKYGGCGNWSSPFWTHYGNDLVFYDPGTERWYTRRVGDVSGALRPANGCTRSVVYDPIRKVSWLIGGVGSGPYNPAPASSGGNFAYDLERDRFTLEGTSPPSGLGNVGCNLAFSPTLGVAVLPDDGATWVFDAQTASWSSRTSPDSPGRPYAYERIAWVSSQQAFFALGTVGASPTQRNTTMRYEPTTNTWTDLQAANQPPFRGSKYGLVYDSKNDVLLLFGGGTGWNVGWRNDLWAYSVAQNQWQQLTPTVVGGGAGPALTDNMPSAYDPRHNAVIFTEGNSAWAYRYRR